VSRDSENGATATADFASAHPVFLISASDSNDQEAADKQTLLMHHTRTSILNTFMLHAPTHTALFMCLPMQVNGHNESHVHWMLACKTQPNNSE
jgi:hypothetical protein